MPEWANLLVIFFTVLIVAFFFGKAFRPLIEEAKRRYKEWRGVPIRRVGQTLGNAGNSKPSYYICTSCLQSYIHPVNRCIKCGEATLIVVTPTGEIKKRRIETDGRKTF